MKAVTLIQTIMVALAFSLDAFLTGLACGSRQLKTAPSAGLFVGLASALTFASGATLGSVAAVMVPITAGRIIGSVALAAIGIWLLVSARNGSANPAALADQADRDGSGHLSWLELGLLGVGLGTDGFAGGFALALPGLPARAILLATTVLCLATALAFQVGSCLGAYSAALGRLRHHTLRTVAGCTLVLLATLRAIG